MSSLREIKDRIGSVKSTLKITSAMKLVASSKLRKAQKAIETLRPYEETLCGILSSLTSGSASGQTPPTTVSLRSTPPQAVPPLTVPREAWVAGAVCPDAVDTPAPGSAADEREAEVKLARLNAPGGERDGAEQNGYRHSTEADALRCR